MAAVHGVTEAIDILLRADANNQNVFASHTPLILAALGNYVEVVKVLLDAGVDVGRHNQWGVTALRNAQGHEELEKMLRDAGADE